MFVWLNCYAEYRLHLIDKHVLPHFKENVVRWNPFVDYYFLHILFKRYVTFLMIFFFSLISDCFIIIVRRIQNLHQVCMEIYHHHYYHRHQCRFSLIESRLDSWKTKCVISTHAPCGPIVLGNSGRRTFPVMHSAAVLTRGPPAPLDRQSGYPLRKHALGKLFYSNLWLTILFLTGYFIQHCDLRCVLSFGK